MPWVEEEERHNKPEDVSGEEGDDQRKEYGISEKIDYVEAMSLNFGLDGLHRDENRCEHEVDHYKTPEVYHGHVELVRSLRPITHRQDETGEERGKIEPLENDSEDLTRRTEKVGIPKRRRQYPENKEEITLQKVH